MNAKYTEQQKKQILEEVKNTKNIVVVAKKYNIPTTTIHTWLYRLRNLSAVNNNGLAIENKQLKKTLVDKDLEISVLKELLKKTCQVLG